VGTEFEFIGLVNQLKATKIRLKISRPDGEHVIVATPRANPPAGQGALGVGIRTMGKIQTTVLKAPLAAFYETGRIIALSFVGVVNFAKQLVVQHQVSDEVTGIVGVGALTGIARRLGFQY